MIGSHALYLCLEFNNGYLYNLLNDKIMNRNKSISFGDKIFTRVTRNGQTIFNFVSEKVLNMTDLLAQLRKAMKDVKGLVILHIRNYDQGWGDERPLMLYASKAPQYAGYNQVIETTSIERPANKMLFPWETH